MKRWAGGTAPTAELRALAGARIAFGCLLLLRTTALGAALHIGDFQVPLLGWPAPGFRGQPIVILPDDVVRALCVARTLAAAAFLAGFHTRIAGVIAGVAGFVVLSQEPFAFIFTLHLLYLGTIVLALADTGCAWAVRPEPPRAPASSVLLLRVFVTSIYFWAGIYKLRPDWLDGRTLELYHRDRALVGPLAEVLLATELRSAITACCVALTELALAALLLRARTRRLGIALALGFHLAIQLVSSPDVLGFEMAALLLALWPARARGERTVTA